MFENIGSKIKSLSSILCFLGIIASVICAVVMWMANSWHNSTIGLGFAVLIGGCFASWIGNFIVYGFGQLIEDTQMIRQMLARQLGEDTPVAPAVAAAEVDRAMPDVDSKEVCNGQEQPEGHSKEWRCPVCSTINTGKSFCRNCGTMKPNA